MRALATACHFRCHAARSDLPCTNSAIASLSLCVLPRAAPLPSRHILTLHRTRETPEHRPATIADKVPDGFVPFVNQKGWHRVVFSITSVSYNIWMELLHIAVLQTRFSLLWLVCILNFFGTLRLSMC
ncbi:unnamed protein product [Cuscuta campestris]|uniref:Uncharacterized protein n=1 Tax=Cuscuta campestris TaxID=132261 RepID=A0A484KUC9_9ASTE|nr:unnamed protein product [Cuscuta campestris]